MSPREEDPLLDPLQSGTAAGDAPSAIERLLAGHTADPRLAAAALDLRRELIEQYGADSAVDRALVDGAATGYYLQQLLGTWTATIAETLEREIFKAPDGTPSRLPLHQLAQPNVEHGLRRVADQVALQERAARLLARNLAALRARKLSADGAIGYQRSAISQPKRGARTRPEAAGPPRPSGKLRADVPSALLRFLTEGPDPAER